MNVVAEQNTVNLGRLLSILSSKDQQIHGAQYQIFPNIVMDLVISRTIRDQRHHTNIGVNPVYYVNSFTRVVGSETSYCRLLFP